MLNAEAFFVSTYVQCILRSNALLEACLVTVHATFRASAVAEQARC